MGCVLLVLGWTPPLKTLDRQSQPLVECCNVVEKSDLGARGTPSIDYDDVGIYSVPVVYVCE